MSGRGRLTLCAAAATLMAACSLLPLVDPATWILQAAFLLAILSGVGALTRRVPLARPLTVLTQAVGALLLLTLTFARDQAVGGVLPGPRAFTEFGQLLAEGVDDVGHYAIPAPVTTGIRLLLVGGVVVIGLIVDALAVTYRSAAPAGLPLLALYSVAAGLSQGGARWLWFLLASAGFLLLLLAEGRDRLSQWGRVFAGSPGLRNRGGPGGFAGSTGASALAPLSTGRRIGAVALGIALVVPAVLPALSGGLLDTRGREGGRGTGGGTISAVNPLVSLQNSLNQPEDREVLRYRTDAPSAQDLYLRIVALDRFDGSAWKPSERRVADIPSPMPAPAGLGPQVRTRTVNTSVAAAAWYAQTWLPLPYPATRVAIDGRWRYEPEGRTLVGDRGQSTRGARYQVASLLVQPTARQLATAGPPPEQVLREYTRVPDSLPPVVHRTALAVTEGASNPYEKAVHLQDWFASEGGFTYDTEVDAGSGSQAIARFLRQKEGFCVHFAFSMAAMARTLGIPARVAVGFTPGTAQTDGSMSVGLKDAHAWPELYFPGTGWTRFEPTPTRGSVPDYTVAESSTGGGTDPGLPSTGDSAAPSTAPSSADTCPREMKKLGGCPTPGQQLGGGSGGSGPRPGAVAAAVAVALLVVGVPLLPLLWRWRARRLRLRGEGAGRNAADRTLAAWRELLDSGWDYGIPPDESQTPRRAAERIVDGGSLRGLPAESVRRVATAVEQVLYAPEPRPVPGLADDVHRVRSALRVSAGRWVRLRALLAPRSSVRLLWSLSHRWAELKHRVPTDRWAELLRRRPFGQRG